MMQISNGTSTSVWMATAQVPEFAPLSGDTDTDICIIGAGIGGLTTAYRLAREGKHVIVIDALGIGAGETGRTTAHFFPPDEWYAGLTEMFGAAAASQVAQAFSAATEWVERTVTEEQIDCHFRRLDGYLYALRENGFKDLRKEYDAAIRAGVPVEYLSRVPGLSFDTGPCIRYPNQAQFHPLAYLAGLAQAIMRYGGEICCQTRALAIERDHAEQVVVTDRGKIRANAVVVATNTPFNNRVALHTKQAAYRTYVVGLRVPKRSVPSILLWDTGDPYYYIRLDESEPDDDILIVGGADHKSGQDTHPEHRYAEIERWVREHYPMAEETLYRWSGEIMEPADGLAFLGRNPFDSENVFVISGDSGNGMTHCTLGAMIISDLIQGRGNPWSQLYDPRRLITHGMSEFLSEQANTLAQYADWMKKDEIDSVLEIAAGQGAVVHNGLKKIAAYRDAQGELHALSAKCTHLGCVVHWNSAEQSWDCPCHGSRFSVSGEVLHGPAARSLEQAALPPSGIDVDRDKRSAEARNSRHRSCD